MNDNVLGSQFGLPGTDNTASATGIIDTHCHLYEPDYDGIRDELIKELPKNGIEKLICVGCNIKTTKQSIELAQKYDFIYAQAGFHPCDTSDITDEMWAQMQELASHPKVVAIGEIGLDYHWDSSPREKQQYWFAKQIEFAGSVNLPVVIHSRDATADTLKILKEHQPECGVFHCFSGSVETLKEVLKLGLSISLGGVVTFKNAKNAAECAKSVPLDRLMLETDCPYLAPEPFRGKLNRPDYTVYIAQKIAQLRGMNVRDVIDITRKNAEIMFKI